MVHESSARRNKRLQSSIQRPDRPGIAPEFPVALEALKLGGHHALFSMAITTEQG
jgi:hypothetical protein